jgi:hypothetical protein
MSFSFFTAWHSNIIFMVINSIISISTAFKKSTPALTGVQRY